MELLRIGPQIHAKEAKGQHHAQLLQHLGDMLVERHMLSSNCHLLIML